MRTDRVISSSRSLVRGLRSSTRRTWWTSFLLVTILGAMWGLANAPFAGPDEYVHVIRAHALDHGQIIGQTPSARVTRELRRRGERTDVLNVRAPEIYTGGVCFAFRPDVSAACLEFAGSRHDTDAAIYTARHPPAYYALVGVVSWLERPGPGVVYLMRLIGALITGAFVATAITAMRRTKEPRLVAVGLLLAFTPMVLFISGVVNPSVPEIAASLALWVCGLALVAGSREQVDNRLVTAVGIAGCTLALSRQLGPLWIGLIALTMLGMTNRRLLANLLRSNWARLWGGLILASSLAQLAWDAVVKPLDVASSGGRRQFDTSEVLRNAFGASFHRAREMIGIFGWIDTPSPTLTWLPWIAMVGVLFFLAVMWARRRDVRILIGLLVATIVLPALIESTQYGTAGGAIWQGRYTLPLAVGIPVVAATALGSTERGRQIVTNRLLLTVGIVVCAAQILAFAQNLRRYTVGYDGELQYWRHPEWSPPISSLLLTIAYAIVFIGFVSFLFAAARSQMHEGADQLPRSEGLRDAELLRASSTSELTQSRVRNRRAMDQ
jgi:hypothetical protein